MSVALTINGVVKTKSVQWKTLRVNNVLTNQVDTASFDILYEGVANTYKPRIGQIVTIADGATTIFAGPIVRVDETALAYGTILYSVECSDYSRFLDRKLVVDVYENMTVAEIIAQIVTDYTTDGFTTTHVACDIEVDYVAFNYETVTDCFKQLAELVSFDWYVDENKDIHFFSREVNSAPFSLTDTSGNWDYRSLVIRNDNSQIRNQVYVRGGEYLGTEFTAVIQATGADIIYPLGYRYQDFDVTLTGHVLNVGIDGIDNPDLFDVLYNYQEKIIRFRESRKPTASSDIRVSGKPYIPVIVKVADFESQASMATAEGGDGVYEALIIDKSIATKQAARDRADAEIERYKETIVEAEFRTTTAGLRAGQQINLDIDSRDIDADYIINKVQYRMWSPNVMSYQVSLISTKTYGILDWMQRQLRSEKKTIQINPDEIQDVVNTADDRLSVAETVAVGNTSSLTDQMGLADTFTSYVNNQPTWVAGPYSPVSLEDRKRPAFADRDCMLGS